jgi:hypothetical protein
MSVTVSGTAIAVSHLRKEATAMKIKANTRAQSNQATRAVILRDNDMVVVGGGLLGEGTHSSTTELRPKKQKEYWVVPSKEADPPDLWV